MPENTNKSLTSDLLSGVLKNPETQQKIAGLIMGAIGKLLGKLFGGGEKKEKPTSSSPIPEGSVVVTPNNSGGDVEINEATGRVWSGLLLTVKGVKRDKDGPGGPAPAIHIPDSELAKVRDLSDPVDDGDVVNLDVTPLDQFGGKILTGDPENAQLLIDPAKGTDKDDSGDNHRLHYAVGGGDFEVNGTNRNYGCNPNLKIPRGFKGEAVAVVSVFATTPAGKTITSNAIRVRVKPWA